MTFPRLHLNGTSFEALEEGICNALEAVNQAFIALQAARPNGRDYYPQGPHAFAAAEREHEARLEHLRVVERELVHVLEDLQRQNDERNALKASR